jgi:hypothetical protein
VIRIPTDKLPSHEEPDLPIEDWFQVIKNIPDTSHYFDSRNHKNLIKYARLCTDRYQWCIDNVGLHNESWTSQRGYGTVTYYFKDEKDALMFSLQCE